MIVSKGEIARKGEKNTNTPLTWLEVWAKEIQIATLYDCMGERNTNTPRTWLQMWMRGIQIVTLHGCEGKKKTK